jgi:hypothetical protein
MNRLHQQAEAEQALRYHALLQHPISSDACVAPASQVCLSSFSYMTAGN